MHEVKKIVTRCSQVEDMLNAPSGLSGKVISLHPNKNVAATCARKKALWFARDMGAENAGGILFTLLRQDDGAKKTVQFVLNREQLEAHGLLGRNITETLRLVHESRFGNRMAGLRKNGTVSPAFAAKILSLGSYRASLGVKHSFGEPGVGHVIAKAASAAAIVKAEKAAIAARGAAAKIKLGESAVALDAVDFRDVEKCFQRKPTALSVPALASQRKISVPVLNVVANELPVAARSVATTSFVSRSVESLISASNRVSGWISDRASEAAAAFSEAAGIPALRSWLAAHSLGILGRRSALLGLTVGTLAVVSCKPSSKGSSDALTAKDTSTKPPVPEMNAGKLLTTNSNNSIAVAFSSTASNISSGIDGSSTNFVATADDSTRVSFLDESGSSIASEPESNSTSDLAQNSVAPIEESPRPTYTPTPQPTATTAPAVGASYTQSLWFAHGSPAVYGSMDFCEKLGWGSFGNFILGRRIGEASSAYAVSINAAEGFASQFNSVSGVEVVHGTFFGRDAVVTKNANNSGTSIIGNADVALSVSARIGKDTHVYALGGGIARSDFQGASIDWGVGAGIRSFSHKSDGREFDFDLHGMVGRNLLYGSANISYDFTRHLGVFANGNITTLHNTKNQNIAAAAGLSLKLWQSASTYDHHEKSLRFLIGVAFTEGGGDGLGLNFGADPIGFQRNCDCYGKPVPSSVTFNGDCNGKLKGILGVRLNF